MAATLAGGADDDFDRDDDMRAFWRKMVRTKEEWFTYIDMPPAFFPTARDAIYADILAGPIDQVLKIGRAHKQGGYLEQARLNLAAAERGWATVIPIRNDADISQVAPRPVPANLLEYFSGLAPSKEALRHVLLTLAMTSGVFVALAVSPLAIAAAIVGGTTVLTWLGGAVGGIATLTGSIVGIRRMLASRRSGNEGTKRAEAEDETSA